MKISDLFEVYSTSSMSSILKKSLEHQKALFSQYEYIGDINFFTVHQYDHGDDRSMFIIRHGDHKDEQSEIKYVAMFEVECWENGYNINAAYIDEEYRSKRLFIKFLYFIKTRLNYNPIFLGKSHSNDMKNFITKLSNHVDLYWYNIKTKEKVKFNLSEIKLYISDKFDDIVWIPMIYNMNDYSNVSEGLKFTNLSNINSSFIFDLNEDSDQTIIW